MTQTTKANLKNENAPRRDDGPKFLPRTDVFESEKEFVLRIDLPGVADTDVDLHLEERVLSIRGRVSATDPGERRLTLREYEVGDYVRSFSLGDKLDTNKIEASMTHGVLTIRLPKIEETQPRHIPVRAT